MAVAATKLPFIPDDFFVVKETGLSQFQAITAYLGGSMFQTIMDNPVTAYRSAFYFEDSAFVAVFLVCVYFYLCLAKLIVFFLLSRNYRQLVQQV